MLDAEASEPARRRHGNESLLCEGLAHSVAPQHDSGGRSEENAMKAHPLAAVLSALALCGPAFAQEGHDMGRMDAGKPIAAALPSACPVAGATGGAGMAMPPMPGASESQRALMQSTMVSQDAMMLGMSAADPDVAFACAMIPHHRSAIEMARVEIQDGRAAPMRAMAQAIIAAQEREIAELTEWLEQQPR